MRTVDNDFQFAAPAISKPYQCKVEVEVVNSKHGQARWRRPVLRVRNDEKSVREMDLQRPDCQNDGRQLKT